MGWGYGACLHTQWLSIPLSVTLQDAGRESIEEDSVAVRELVPVVVAAAS